MNKWNPFPLAQMIHKKWKSLYTLLCCLLLTLTSSAFSSTNSAEIIADTLAGLPACLHYEIKGTCFWLNATGAIITTPYIQHYLPDAVVSVFNEPGDNPWLEINTTLDIASAEAQTGLISALTGMIVGGGQHSFHQPMEQHVYFKEVDIIGNPALPTLPTTPVLLPTAAIPLMPYFQSMLDSVLWRGFPPLAIPEQTMALGEDVVHTIGKGATVWGGTYPFEGKVITGNDQKAAAVIAQRASQMLTAVNSWGHVHQSLPTVCGTECQAAIIQDNNNQTQFQWIYPTLETSCHVFGYSSDYGEHVKTPAHGAYVWVLWRKYRGCVQAPGSVFIDKIVI